MASWIVGLWKSDFLIGDGPDLFDQAFNNSTATASS
jgi:hypothetical protein